VVAREPLECLANRRPAHFEHNLKVCFTNDVTRREFEAYDLPSNFVVGTFGERQR
jgi:hypothetical protein